ncbi:hypothetical protein CJI59_16700 [Streptomyces sp. Alain-F2R5]|nr:hypothetical protein CJI59_16700 [Streptomyces sp. Alain-F2R5]
MWFLQARLREDEKTAKAVKSGKNEVLAELRDRVLADVEAKRRLLDWATEPPRVPEVGDLPRWGAIAMDAAVGTAISMKLNRRRPVIDHLVAAYEGHPDFRSEWKQLHVEDEYGPADQEERR